jgi:hypothetical protein
MGSTAPPGDDRRRATRCSADHLSEQGNDERNGRRDDSREETPEDAACAIADALDFLAREMATLGAEDACGLVRRASARMRELARREG